MDPNENKQEQVMQTLQETTELRSKRTQVSTGTGVVILLTVAYLCFDLSFFARSYDASRIADEVQNEIPRLLQYEDTQKLMDDISSKVIPAYIDALKNKMSSSEDLYEEECLNVLEMLEQDVGPAVQKKITVELGNILIENESMIHSRYPDFTSEEMALIRTSLQSEITTQYKQRSNQEMSLLFGDISQNLKAMRNDAIYQELATQDSPHLERMLLTSSLELIIHEIDPDALTR